MRLTLSLIFWFLAWSCPVWAQNSYVFSSARLLTKNLQDMDQWLRVQLTKARENPDAQILYCVQGVQALMSRPDMDNAIEKLLPQVLYFLDGMGITYSVMEAFVQDALKVLTQKPQLIAADVRATYAIGLENWLIQMKPYVVTLGLQGLYEQVARSEIVIDPETRSWADSTMAYKLKDLKSLAQSLLAQVEKPKNSAKSEDSDSPSWQSLELRKTSPVSESSGAQPEKKSQPSSSREFP